MLDTLMPLALATAAFVGGHFLLSSTPVRGRLRAWIGHWPFLGLYSAVAIVAFVAMCWTFARSPMVVLWPRYELAWAVSLAVMPFAAILVVAGYLSANPSAVGGERALARDDPARGIFRVTRHPILWGIALWALVHLIALGDGAAIIFFGGFALLALGGIAHIEARRAAGNDPGWQRLTASSSALPFAAAIKGRVRISLSEIGWRAIVLGLAFYLVLLFGHRYAIGPDVVPRL